MNTFERLLKIIANIHKFKGKNKGIDHIVSRDTRGFFVMEDTSFIGLGYRISNSTVNGNK